MEGDTAVSNPVSSHVAATVCGVRGEGGVWDSRGWVTVWVISVHCERIGSSFRTASQKSICSGVRGLSHSVTLLLALNKRCG